MVSGLVGGRRTVGFGYLLHHHPWLLVLVLVLLVALLIWVRRNR